MISSTTTKHYRIYKFSSSLWSDKWLTDSQVTTLRADGWTVLPIS